MSNRIGNFLVAGILGVGAAFFTWQASLLGVGDFASPGAGFFPFLLGAILLLLALLIGLDCWRSLPIQTVEIGHRDVAVAMAVLLLVPLLFDLLGAPIALGLFGVANLVLIGRISALLAIAASTLGMIGCWYFFQVLLGVQLPMGPL